MLIFLLLNLCKRLCMIESAWIFSGIYNSKTDHSKSEAQQSMIFLCTQVWGFLYVYHRDKRHWEKSVLTFLKGHIPLILITVLVLLKWLRASTRRVEKCWLARSLHKFKHAEVFFASLHQSWKKKSNVVACVLVSLIIKENLFSSKNNLL